eukprot:4557571-Amphidinium_carterae.1
MCRHLSRYLVTAIREVQSANDGPSSKDLLCKPSICPTADGGSSCDLRAFSFTCMHCILQEHTDDSNIIHANGVPCHIRHKA